MGALGSDDSDGISTSPVGRRGAAHVRVFGERVFLAYPAPASGVLTIGRSEECDIVVAEHSVSRVHANLHFGEGIAIEDAGSSHGTRVGSIQLGKGQRVPLMPGQVAELGAVLVVIDAARPSRPLTIPGRTSPRRVWEHEHFEARLEEHCRLEKRSDAPFAIARVTASANADAAALEGALASLLSEDDWLARYAPGWYEMALMNRSQQELRSWCTTASAILRSVAPCEVVVARFPDDGCSADELQAALSRALERSNKSGGEGSDITVLDDSMRVLHRLLDRVAGSDISVLLTGETGAGKEVLAERLHRSSRRNSGPFLKLNCAALVEPLAESELFGHEKGAFTGAARTKQGLFEAANGGTIFLDEIGEMPLALQAKLLRVLDERLILPVGAVKPRPIDVRFVAATNRELEDEIIRGRFRQDLYFRLSGVVLAIPPLRERPREIQVLAEAFVGRAARALGVATPRLLPNALDALASYPWPGNVRELKNVIERAVLLAQSHEITAAELALDKVRIVAPARSAMPMVGGDLAEHLDTVERQRILDMLEACGGNQSEAARRLGMSRGTLIVRLDRYGVARPRKPSS